MKSKIILPIVAILLVALFAVYYFSVPKLTYAEYLQQGIEYESKGEMGKAIDSYEKAARRDPKQYVSYSNLGTIYQKQKDFTKAEVSFKKALEINPQAISVYKKIYDLYRYDFRKHPDFMMPFFAEIIKTTDNNIDIVKLYAFYLEDVNDPEPALAIWKAFSETEPNNEIYKAKIKTLEAKIKSQER